MNEIERLFLLHIEKQRNLLHWVMFAWIVSWKIVNTFRWETTKNLSSKRLKKFAAKHKPPQSWFYEYMDEVY